MIGSQIERLKHIRMELAGEIETASQEGDMPVMASLVMARDNLNDALIAAGDEETARTVEKHAHLDELMGMAKGGE